MSVSARSTLDNARLHVAGVDDTGAFYREDDDLDAGSDYDVLGSDDDDVAGTIVYRTPTGSGTVSVSFLGEEYSIAGVARCQFAGTAVARAITGSLQADPALRLDAKPCTQRTKVLISRAPNTQGGDAVPGRLKLAITLALAGLIVGATPVLASNGSHGRTPMAGYTGKVQNLVLRDTTAGRHSSFIVELKQQADLSKAYTMKNQDARGWYVYRTLKRTAEKTQGPLKAMLDAQGVSYRSFWVANELVVHQGSRALVDTPRRPARRQGDRGQRRLELAQLHRRGHDGLRLRDHGGGERAEEAGHHRAECDLGEGSRPLEPRLHRHRDRRRQPGHGHALDARRAQAALPRLERRERRPQLQLARLDPRRHQRRRRRTRADSTPWRRATTTATGRTRPARQSETTEPATRSASLPARSGSAAATWTRANGRPETYTECFQFFIAPTDLNGPERRSDEAAARDEQQLGLPDERALRGGQPPDDRREYDRGRASSSRSPRGTPGRAAAASTIRRRSTRRPTPQAPPRGTVTRFHWPASAAEGRSRSTARTGSSRTSRRPGST